MNTFNLLVTDIDSLTTAIAAAVVKITTPIKDDISERQARSAYGTRWLNRQIKLGLVKPSYTGNKKVFSRHRLDCIRAAERQALQSLIIKDRVHDSSL